MDKLSKEKRSWNMSRIRSKNTAPELAVRIYLFSKGIRYRVNVKIPGKPDIAIKKIKTAVFVNGCFWHGHENCKDSGIPKSNTKFWKTKIESNMARDRRNIELLTNNGWRVVTIWECELLKKADIVLESLANDLLERLKSRN